MIKLLVGLTVALSTIALVLTIASVWVAVPNDTSYINESEKLAMTAFFLFTTAVILGGAAFFVKLFENEL